MAQHALMKGEVVAAFDPGKTTGYAIATYLGEGQIALLDVGQLAWDDFEGMENVINAADWVVTERFSLYASKASSQINSEFPSSQVIGAIRHHAWQLGKLDHVVIQPASERTMVAVLPEHEPWLRGKPHGRDAYYHLRYFAVLNKRNDKEAP